MTNGTFQAALRRNSTRLALYFERYARYSRRVAFHFKCAKVPEEMECRDPFVRMRSKASDFSVAATFRYACYRGKLLKPEWMDQDACELIALLASATTL